MSVEIFESYTDYAWQVVEKLMESDSDQLVVVRVKRPERVREVAEAALFTQLSSQKVMLGFTEAFN